MRTFHPERNAEEIDVADSLFEPREVAEILGVSRTWVYELVRQGALHGARVGDGKRARIRISGESLIDYIAAAVKRCRSTGC
jgi:excisionase family DNA binding protein